MTLKLVVRPTSSFDDARNFSNLDIENNWLRNSMGQN